MVLLLVLSDERVKNYTLWNNQIIIKFFWWYTKCVNMAFSNIKDDAFYWTLWDLSEAALEWVWSGRYWRLGPNIFPIRSWALAHDDDDHDDDDNDDDDDDDDDDDGRYWRLGLRPKFSRAGHWHCPADLFLQNVCKVRFTSLGGCFPAWMKPGCKKTQKFRPVCSDSLIATQMLTKSRNQNWLLVLKGKGKTNVDFLRNKWMTIRPDEKWK